MSDEQILADVKECANSTQSKINMFAGTVPSSVEGQRRTIINEQAC